MFQILYPENSEKTRNPALPLLFTSCLTTESLIGCRKHPAAVKGGSLHELTMLCASHFLLRSSTPLQSHLLPYSIHPSQPSDLYPREFSVGLPIAYSLHHCVYIFIRNKNRSITKALMSRYARE